MGQEIIEVLEYIADYGVTLIIAAIFLYVVIRLINIGLHYVEGRFKHKRHSDLIDLRGEVSEKVQQLIAEFLETSKGNRVQVIEFSNSVLSVAYLPFKYMTCTYEAYALGRSAMGHTIDRISTSLFTAFFTKLQNSDYYILDTTEGSGITNGAIYDLMKHQNETKSLCSILRTSKGKAIGYVALKKDEAFTESDIEGIQSLADQISALLGIVDR